MRFRRTGTETIARSGRGDNSCNHLVLLTSIKT
jgi:hypothetical protein